MKRGGTDVPQKLTMKMVAARAGVDVSVISRLINNDPKLRISETTRARATSVIRELNYRPDPAGRELRCKRSGIIGLLIPDYGNPIYGQIIRGAEEAAVERGYLLMTSSADGGLWDEVRLAERVNSGRFDGVLIAQNHCTEGMLRLMGQLPFSTLLLNQQSTVYSRYLCVNDERAARLAVAHLIELGHRSIGIVGGPQGVDTAERRQTGALETLREAGIDPPAGGVLRVGYDFESGAGAFERLMALKQRPTAIFTANVAAAIGVLHQAWQRGISIPGELSVITIHDLPLGKYLNPALTTVHMPLAEMGRRGVELLDDFPADAIINEMVETDPQLVIRASTAPPPVSVS